MADTRTCHICMVPKPADREHFNVDRKAKDGLDPYCKPCTNELGKKRHHAQRLEVLRHYSGGEPRCACCGETTVEFLCIDLIFGGGNKHRRETGTLTGKMYRWLKKSGFPEGFRVLCHNCNMARGFYGRCPHELASMERAA